MRISYLKERQSETDKIADFIRRNSFELDDNNTLDILMQNIGDAKYVLLGEASHGTHEYYTWRAKISKRLIKEKRFSFIAVEGDWPDCYRVNHYVKRYADTENAGKVLHEFNRWPTWMWANWEIVAMAEWMRSYNKEKPYNKRIGFYGLDVYSLWDSLEAIINYLDKVDPEAKKVAMEAWKCFEPYSEEEGQSYARATAHPWVPASCESEVIDLLANIRKRMENYDADPEAVLNTEQNALVAVSAERYYRAMISGGPESWNIRDHHMVDTLNRLMRHHDADAKAIVWEHNTHIGDASATDMRDDGMVNVGQIMNETHAFEGVYSIGFGSYEGTVIAGRSWGDDMRRMEVPKAKPGSWESMLHAANSKKRLVIMNEDAHDLLGEKEIGHRAIGVVYHPEREWGNYVPSILPKRYNAFIYLDKTMALHPLHIKPDGHQVPETYPFGV